MDTDCHITQASSKSSHMFLKSIFSLFFDNFSLLYNVSSPYHVYLQLFPKEAKSFLSTITSPAPGLA